MNRDRSYRRTHERFHCSGDHVWKGAGLSRDTPLLEWGLINSLEMRALIAFIEREFSVHVPPEQVIAKNFASIAALARMTRGLLEASSGPTSAPTLAGVARR